MNKWWCILLYVCLAKSFAVQKIFRPNTTTVLIEKVTESSMGVTLDVNVIEGESLYIMSGMKGRSMDKVELTGTYRKSIEPKEAGEYEVRIINSSDKFANVSVSVYVDKAHEDTDEAEVLRKLLDKVRVDLMNIYNDVLKLKNANTQSLRKAKSAKSILWVLAIFPVLYVVLSYTCLVAIKGFFSSKTTKKI